MQTANCGGFCLGLTMDSNDNVTGAIPRSGTLGSPKRTWKDVSPPTSIRTDFTTMAESGNANSRNISGNIQNEDRRNMPGNFQNEDRRNMPANHQNVDSSGGDDCSGSSSSSGCGSTGVRFEQKIQIADGPVIRMGTGALTSRRHHPNSLPMKHTMTTWKDVSPPKEKRNSVDVSKLQNAEDGKSHDVPYEPKNRSPIRTNPFHEVTGVYRGIDGNFQSVKRVKTDMIGNIFDGIPMAVVTVATTATAEPQQAVAVTAWQDVSLSKGQPDGKKRRPESGYFSNDVQSEGGQESREGIDTSLSDSECVQRERSNSAAVPSDEGCFNSDYFFEDEFSVQFDTNLREAQAAGEQCATTEGIILPHSLNGSYTKFGGLRDSLLQPDMYLGLCESELSGSRTSMEISSSEREMMCSSDMLNFSNEPLFTPTPPPVEQQQQHNLSVDSLSHQGNGGEMANSRSSTETNLVVDCCIRKDAYFLSFNASQEQHSTSESEISCGSHGSSHDGQEGESQTDNSQSENSNAEDAEDERSSSFQFQEDKQDQKQPQNPPSSNGTQNHYYPVRNMLLSRYPGRICLEALQEYLLDRSSSTKSPGSSRHSCSSNCKLSPLCGGTFLSSGDLLMSGVARRPGLRRSSNLTTWKQVRNIRKLGKEQNLHEGSRSLPDLTAEDVKVVRREKPNRTIDSIADSFHNKRHSAHLLEMYQQMLMGSNPPSPTTLSRIDQILFTENFHQTESSLKHVQKQDCDNHSTFESGRQKDFHLDLPKEVLCGRSLHTAETDISPQTVMLWHGQKNFSSQFPPNTTDCGIQTSMEEQENRTLNSRSIQTSPSSPGVEICHMLNELREKDLRQSRNHDREKPISMPRAKSATECRDTHAERLKTQMRRTVSLSPSRIGMNSFYTHQSLPDLSFLSGSSRRLSKSRESCSSAMSLFDPVQIPIILTPVVSDGSRSSHSRSSASSHCECSKDPPPSVHGPRRSKPSQSGKSSSGNSSGSNYSLCSSSGVDPCFLEPRACVGLPPELEHLLFLPPHMESAYNQLGLSETSSRCMKPNHAMEESDENNISCKEKVASGSPVIHTSKIDRYIYETHPYASQTKSANKTSKEGQGIGKGSANGSPSSDRLDALKEEKTPSPEPSYCHYQLRDYSDHQCFSFDDGSEGESSQELDEDKLRMYQQWLQERKPPLKSCLRKRCDRDQKARSLSNLVMDAQQEDPPAKPPRKQNRHSIACDGLFPVLVNEEGFEYAYKPDPPPRNQSLQTAEYKMPENTMETVVMRRKKTPPPVINESAEGSSLDDTNRAKRVSFASEVSFHSPNYTPQCSPKRQTGQGEVTSIELEDDILTLHIVQKGADKANHLGRKGDDPGCDTSQGSQASSDIPPHEFSVPPLTEEGLVTELSPLDYKSNILRGVIQAAEILVRHFAQARDPFDKVRLGSAQETPALGALVVTSLCPAIERAVHDGMKPFLTGFHIFGKIHASPWRLAEASAEIGPYTRAINELVKQLKVRANLVSHRQKFYAFLAGLLNLRLLDFWMGYISSKENTITRFFEEDAILCLSRTNLEQKYEDMLLALQPLAVLPFQVDYEIVANYSLVDSAYMGESLEMGSPKIKSDLSSSPKVVVARAKNRVGSSPDRSSWSGPSERQDSYLLTDKVDFSATWDWIKTATLPKARSLMSDIALTMSSGTSASGASSCANGVKVSRLSQDLASIGIVASRQNMSASGSSTSGVAGVSLNYKQESPTVSRQPETVRPTLPAVVIDHGTKHKGSDHARQKAEDILQRRCSTSPQKRLEGSPIKSDTVRHDFPQAFKSPSGSPNKGGIYIQKTESSSPRKGDNPFHDTPESSPTRQAERSSPQRQISGSPQRGPKINPGSPKSVIVAKTPDSVDYIKRQVSKIALEDFPDDVNEYNSSALGDGQGNNSSSSLHSPLASFSSLAQKWLPRKEERVYREGKTDYVFDNMQLAQAVSLEQITSPTSSGQPAQSSPQKQSPSNSGKPTSRFSGLKKLSPRGSFNIISFFDRLLLPSEKVTTPPSSVNNSLPTSSVLPGPTSIGSPVEKSPDLPEIVASTDHQNVQINTATENSTKNTNPLKQQASTQNKKVSKIPKPQLKDREIRSLDNRGILRTDPKDDPRKHMMTISKPNPNIQPFDCLPSPFETGSNTEAEVDINANSPDFHHRHYTMFDDRSPTSACQKELTVSTEEQSNGSGQSVSMTEDDQTLNMVQKGKLSKKGEAFKIPDFKYVQTLVSCDPDDCSLLSYDPGEYLEVLAQLDEDWLYCANGRIEGLVRSSAVRPLLEGDVFETLHNHFYQ